MVSVMSVRTAGMGEVEAGGGATAAFWVNQLAAWPSTCLDGRKVRVDRLCLDRHVLAKDGPAASLLFRQACRC